MKKLKASYPQVLKRQPIGAFLLVGSLTASTPAFAGVSSSLDGFYDGLGFHTNVTSPNTYKGQASSYYNGGGLFVRSKIESAQLAAVTLPSISAGCGGIDAFFGGFSHINADQFVQLGKSVISNAIPFAVDLALQTWAPQIKQIRDRLQSVADDYLNQSINSCETAQAAIGGLAAFTIPATKKHVCATMGTQNNSFADWVAAQNECGVGGQADSQLANAKGDDALKDLTKTSHNIVWSASLKNSFLESDKDLAQFLMSLSGTYIYDKDGKPTYYPSLLTDNNNLMNALLEGGKVDTYACDDTDKDKCLVLTKKTINLPESKGLQTRVYNMLTSYHNSLVNDTALSNSQKSFLEYIKLPILAYIKDAVSDKAIPHFDEYARVTSVELLNTYLVSMLNVVKHSLSNTQNDPADIERITNDIAEAKRYSIGLADRAIQSLKDYEQLNAMQREKRKIREQAISRKNQQNYNFEG